MDTARNKQTLEHVDAEELWHISHVDRGGYICIGCKLKATPCSYNKNTNKKRPYFRFDKPDNHEDDCFYEQNEKLVKTAKKRKISTEEGFPLSHPSNLNLNDDRIDNYNGEGQTGVGNFRAKRIGTGGSSSQTKRIHNYSVKTIASIAKHYLKFPFDRSFMRLDITGITGNNSDEVIKKLPNKIVDFKENKLRYGKLDNYKKIGLFDSKLVVQTLQGNWLNGKPQNLFKVVLDITGWNQNKIDYIVKPVEAAQQEFSEDKKKGTYVFFIGEQSPLDASEFIVSDYRLFACFSITP